MSYSIVIPAAGQGKRMQAGRNKQFIELAGKPLIAHTLQIFQDDNWCKEIILVVNKIDMQDMKELIAAYQFSKVSAIVPGGAERQISVAKGLDAIRATNGVVLIHDGARPFIKVEYIHQLVLEAEAKGAAIIAVPVKDTVKVVKDEKVVSTMERSSLWAVQTPQAFRLPLIRRAHQAAMEQQFLGTDDASLVERIGETVSIITGDYMNMKLTTPEDLLFAEVIIQQTRGEQSK